MKRIFHTIVLQEEEIERLDKLNKSLERGYRSIMRENRKLRAQITKLTHRGNYLDRVNV